MDGGAERDRRRDAVGPDDAEPSRDRRAARERSSPCARSTPRRPRPRIAPRCIDRFSAFMPAGFYYKTFFGRAGRPSSRDPRHGRPRPGRSGQSPAGRQSAVQCALRRARRRRRTGGPRGGERGGASGPRASSSSTTTPKSAASSSIAAARSRAETGGTGPQRRARGRSARRTGDDVDDRIRRLRPQSRLRLGAARAPARRAVAHPAASSRRRRRRDRASAGPSRQRSAGRHVGRRGARLSPALRRPRRQAHRRRDQQRQRLSGRRGAKRGGREVEIFDTRR